MMRIFRYPRIDIDARIQGAMPLSIASGYSDTRLVSVLRAAVPEKCMVHAEYGFSKNIIFLF